jgi:outer membrane lipoprotein SlyB
LKETTLDTSPLPAARTRPHPLLIAAALAVIVFCIVGTAAIMGWLPSSTGSNRNQLTDTDRAALAANLQQPAAPPVQPVVAAPVAAPALAAVDTTSSAAQPNAAYGAGQGAAVAGADGQYVAAEPVRAVAPPPPPARVADSGASNWCGTCGNIEAIREIKTRAQGSGVGAAGGAILGGLLGNQLGSGHGRQLATVAGAVGGAVMGNQVEGNMKANISYEIRVRLDDGQLRTFHQHNPPQWRSGDRVRIVKGGLRSA